MTLDHLEQIFALLLDYEITRVSEWPKFLACFENKDCDVIVLAPSRVLKSKEIKFSIKKIGWSVDAGGVHCDDMENVIQANYALTDLFLQLRNK